MLVHQSKGLKHCKDIKQAAFKFWHLTGGKYAHERVFTNCIRLALNEHVELLKEEARIMQKLKVEEPIYIPTNESDPF